MILPKKVVIEINKGILNEAFEKNPQELEKISVNKDVLSGVLEEAEQQDGLIMQVAYLLAGMAWAQPFGGGNKRTGYTCADTYLRMEGFKFVVESKEDIEYLRKLLFDIQGNRRELDSDILSKIVLYVSKRIIKLWKTTVS